MTTESTMPEEVPMAEAVPAEPRPRKGFSYVEIKVFELVLNLCAATVFMVIIVVMTFLIGLLRRH